VRGRERGRERERERKKERNKERKVKNEQSVVREVCPCPCFIRTLKWGRRK
jgi:hypothetical protein